MNDKLFCQVAALLLCSWLIFGAVAGWRQSLWLVPAVMLGIWIFYLSRRIPPKPQRYRSDVTTKQRRVELFRPPPQPSRQNPDTRE